MFPSVIFKDCNFEGNEIKVQVNSNNNNSTTNNYNYGQQQSGENSSTNTPPEGGRQEHDGGTPPHQGNQAPNAAANFQQQTQQVPGQRQPRSPEGTNPDPSPFPPPHHSTSTDNGNHTPSSLPGLVTPSSSCMSSEIDVLSSSSEVPVTSATSEDFTSSDLLSSSIKVTSEDFTSPKQLMNGEEGRAPVADRAEPGEEDDDGEETEEEEGEDAAAGDEKWEVESKEKERDGNPRDLEDVQLSIDESEGSSSASMSASGQQTGDQPMSLCSTPSAVDRPVTTEKSNSPSLASLGPAVSSAGQAPEGESQAQLSAGPLSNLARSRSDPPDTAAQDQMSLWSTPSAMHRPVTTDKNSSPSLANSHLSPAVSSVRQAPEGESQAQLSAGPLSNLARSDPPNTAAQDQVDLEETAVDPTEQATGPSNGDADPPQPPHPLIRLQVSPEEPIEGDRVDFELLNVPLHDIGDVVWNHNGRRLQQAFGLHYTIHSVSQTDAGVYQCIIHVYKEKEKINTVAVVEVTLCVKKSTDVAGQPNMQEEGGSGGSTGDEQQHPGDRNGDATMQTGAPLPGTGNVSVQSTQGSEDRAPGTSVLGATTVNPDYESLQEKYLLGQKLMKEHNDLSYLPFLKGPFPADQRDYVVMNAGETPTLFDPMLEKLRAVVAPDVPATPKKTSPPNYTAPLALSIERKDSAQFVRDGSSGQSISGGETGDAEMDRPGASGSSDRSGEEPSGSGSSCPPGKRQKDARCPDRPPTKPKKLAAQPDIDAIYYKIPLSELMDDADLLDEVKYKLDPDCCGRKNWKNLGAKFEIPRDQLEYFACHGRRTEAVLERVSSERPETSVGDLMNILYQIKRGDVVDMIKQNMCT